jgi:hypothetical protein
MEIEAATLAITSSGASGAQAARARSDANRSAPISINGCRRSVLRRARSACGSFPDPATPWQNVTVSTRSGYRRQNAAAISAAIDWATRCARSISIASKNAASTSA